MPEGLKGNSTVEKEHVHVGFLLFVCFKSIHILSNEVKLSQCKQKLRLSSGLKSLITLK